MISGGGSDMLSFLILPYWARVVHNLHVRLIAATLESYTAVTHRLSLLTFGE